jgi:lysozyme
MKLPPNLVKRVGVVAATFLVASLGVSEGRRHLAYRDVGGVLTVCDGITGVGVEPNRAYTDEQCDALIADRLDELAGEALACVHVPMSIHETVAWVHFSYNVGPAAFCRSTAAQLINEGHHKAACTEITRWTWVAGKDCALKESNCGGLVTRRQRERQMCEGLIPVPGDP